jgi:hypothetical protein
VGSTHYITRGVSIPLGSARTINVQLSSAAPTGPWTVTAVDYDSWVLGAPQKLGLTLDKAEGRNGDVLRLTIGHKATDPDRGFEAFLLISHQGTVRSPDYQTNLTMGLVSE